MQIRGFLLGIVGAAALIVVPAWADTIFEVENARANARAGGPTNEHDAELLDRWGRLSDTGSAGHDDRIADDEEKDGSKARPKRHPERRD